MNGKAGKYLLVALLVCIICVVPALASHWETYWPPWVTKTNTTSATINWRQGNDYPKDYGTLKYANESYYNQYQSFDKKVKYLEESKYHNIELTGLEPDTTYYYQVQTYEMPDYYDVRSFRTFPVSGPFTFIVIADSQKGHKYSLDQRYYVVAQAIAKEPDVLFILHGGDYYGFDDVEGFAEFFHYSNKMLSNTTIFPCIGNHEYHDPVDSNNPPTNADHYKWSFDMPLNYSFDCAGIRFIVLNTPDPNNANHDDPHTSPALAESQVPWLKEQLDNHMIGTFTLQHHPIWDYGRTGINTDLESWENLFHAYPISASFAGHTHNYQRFDVDGIPYFIVGTAGGRFSDLLENEPYPECYRFGETNRLGYLKVKVDPKNKTATAQEILVAATCCLDSADDPIVFDKPVIKETITFPLRGRGTVPEPTEFQADFTATPLAGPAPLKVTFTDTSTGIPAIWNYNFGDGTSSSLKNPRHVYRAAGMYTVTLTVMKLENGVLVRNTTMKQDLITVGREPGSGIAANFSASPLSGPAPLKVTFTDTSTGSPAIWNYNFGDGTSSSLKNPVHTYLLPGEYTVNLTVMKLDRGTLIRNTTVRQDLINVT